METEKWGEFRLGDLFDVVLSRGDIKLDEMSAGNIPLVSSGESNNGVVGFIDAGGDGKAKLFSGGQITVDMFGNVFYQNNAFYAVSHGRINILNPRFPITKNIGLFIATIIKREQFKYSYGRAVYSDEVRNMKISLPVLQTGAPDWDWMENYMKSMPYSDRI